MDAYFDIFSGISGNMVLGALIDLGLDPLELKQELNKLGISDEFELTVNKVKKMGIGGTYVEVELLDNESHHSQPQAHSEDSKEKHDHKHNHNHQDTQQDHKHDHQHHGRSLSDIEKMINNSSLSNKIKKKSKDIFNNLARAEAKIHGTEIEEIHFHEVGAVDAIVDIVGAVIGIELLGIDNIYASRLNTGTGFVRCDHGQMPVPAPATMELLQGVPIYSTGINKELVTPTGAAIITTLALNFGSKLEMKINQTSYGDGSYDLDIPNLLRVNTGQINTQKKTQKNDIKIIEANIDDMNPEFYDYIMDKLFAAGALDVYYTPIHMKKNRSGIKFNVLADSDNTEKIIDIMLTESTTLGVRIIDNIQRSCLNRKTKTVPTPWGEARVKIALKNDKIVNIAPEYEDCKKIAEREGIPLKKIYQVLKENINLSM